MNLRIEDADLVSPIFPEIPHDVVNMVDLLWEAELDAYLGDSDAEEEEEDDEDSEFVIEVDF